MSAPIAPITTADAAFAHRPDVTTYAPAEVLPDALILEHSTPGGEVVGDEPALRVAYFVDDAAVVVDEGAEIDLANPDLDEAVCHTVKVATYVAVSNEQYRRLSTADELARSVERSMTRKVNSLFTAQAAPTSPAVAPVPGLLNQSGVSSVTAVADSFDKLIDLESTVRAAGGVPSAWIMSPAALASLRKFKAATGSNVSLMGAGVEQSRATLLSIPIYVDPSIPAKRGILVDKTAVISASGQLAVSVDHSALHRSDSVAIRATWRVGFVLPRPARVGVFTLT